MAEGPDTTRTRSPPFVILSPLLLLRSSTVTMALKRRTVLNLHIEHTDQHYCFPALNYVLSLSEGLHQENVKNCHVNCWLLFRRILVFSLFDMCSWQGHNSRRGKFLCRASQLPSGELWKLLQMAKWIFVSERKTKRCPEKRLDDRWQPISWLPVGLGTVPHIFWNNPTQFTCIITIICPNPWAGKQERCLCMAQRLGGRAF